MVQYTVHYSIRSSQRCGSIVERWACLFDAEQTIDERSGGGALVELVLYWVPFECFIYARCYEWSVQ